MVTDKFFVFPGGRQPTTVSSTAWLWTRASGTAWAHRDPPRLLWTWMRSRYKTVFILDRALFWVFIGHNWPKVPVDKEINMWSNSQRHRNKLCVLILTLFSSHTLKEIIKSLSSPVRLFCSWPLTLLLKGRKEISIQRLKEYHILVASGHNFLHLLNPGFPLKIGKFQTKN